MSTANDVRARYEEAVAYAGRNLHRSALFGFNSNVDCSLAMPDRLCLPSFPPDLAPVVDALLAGNAGEFRISAKSAGWLQQALRWSPARMGGQAGIMSNAAAALGVNATAFAENRSPELGKLFNRRVNVIGGKGKALSRHFVFEFREGSCVCVGSDRATVRDTNRVIVSHDPADFSLALTPAFKKASVRLAPSLGAAVVSGFHNLDPAIAKKRIAEIAALVRAWKTANPALRVHAELGMFASRAVLQETVARLAGAVDSFGMNELEAAAVRMAGSDVGTLAGEVVIHQAAGSIVLGNTPREHAEDAALFGHALAAFKAVNGRDGTLAEVKRFVSQKDLPFAPVLGGIPAIKATPLFTVGLGDTFIAGYVLVK